MSEPEVAPPAGGGSSLSTLTLVLTSPQQGFRAIAARPVIALALCVLVVLGVAVVGLSMSKVSGADYVRSLQDQGRTVPPQMVDNPEPAMKIARVVAVVFTAVLVPVLYLLFAAVLLVGFRLLGSEIGYRKTLSVVVHGMLPMAIAAVIGIVIVLARDKLSLEEIQGGGVVMSNLGFLAREGGSKAVRALLTSIDLFSLWAIALLATGYRIVAKVSSGAAWGTVLVVWVVGVLIKVGLAAIF
jgi:Yip1 domain